MAIPDLLDLLVKPDLLRYQSGFIHEKTKKACKERNKYRKESLKIKQEISCIYWKGMIMWKQEVRKCFLWILITIIGKLMK